MPRTKTDTRPVGDRVATALEPYTAAAFEAIEPLLEDPASSMGAVVDALVQYAAAVVRVTLKEVVPYRGA